MVGSGVVQNAVDFERRTLQAALHISGTPDPGERHRLDVLVVDLGQRAVAATGVITVVGGPRIRRGMEDPRGVEPVGPTEDCRGGKECEGAFHFKVSRYARRSCMFLSLYSVSSSSCAA